MQVLYLIVLTLSLYGCGFTGDTKDIDNIIGTEPGETGFFDFTLEDLGEAYRSAVTHDDNEAATCYLALGRYVSYLKQYADNKTEVKGAVSAYQKARNIKRVITNGLPPDVRFCSIMFMDNDSLLRRLGAMAIFNIGTR